MLLYTLNTFFWGDIMYISFIMVASVIPHIWHM